MLRIRIYSYRKSMITTNNPDTENMFIVIKDFESFCTCGSRKPWLNINFSKTSNLKVSPYNTSPYKGFVLLRLIEPSYQGPYLEKANLRVINKHRTTRVALYKNIVRKHTETLYSIAVAARKKKSNWIEVRFVIGHFFTSKYNDSSFTTHFCINQTKLMK